MDCMGEHGGRAQPSSGLLPNGLLPNKAASVSRLLDPERLQKAEEITAKLIACIQPNPLSEERRNAVADYVRRLIKKCFPCEVFSYGSVPLKTYLPDGDIDLAVFSANQNLKETWAHQVRDMLENEEKNQNAEFRVTGVQYIQARVKIIKCVVEKIVVDISFNQLDGLATLCFLEKVDHLINQNHLLKRSIILIKVWCYYESRILGASYGLISTFALEMLVLYVFHVFNNSFAGPLEVLYRFLEFYSKFDWDTFCVSIWGPVPISSLPDVTAEPPLKDGGELLFSKLFHDGCCPLQDFLSGGQENQGQRFVSKYFNVIDPFCINSNLGRSVDKGNFFRIRSALVFGAERLASLLDCPMEDLFNEVNQFFLNTWERHGSGHRPDVPRNDLWPSRFSNPDNQHGSENVRNNLSGKRNDVSSMHGSRSVPLEYRKGKSLSEHSSQTDVDSRDWNLPLVLSTTDSSRVASVEPSEHKPDILNGDLASHRKNLQYGRYCQNSQHTAPLVYPSPVVVPPIYLQGQFPWDSPGRSLSNNLNPCTQSVSYGPCMVPVAPLQSVSNRPTNVYQWYDDDMPRYQSGVGTFLPNPKVSLRERHSVSTRRGNYSYDRSDHHGDREGNWNLSSKPRAVGHSHNRSQAAKPTSGSDWLAASGSRTDRPWGSHRNDSFLSYWSQYGPVRLSSTQSGSANVTYGGHLVATLNPSGVSSNGPYIPSIVMPYPYDHTTGYGSPAEQLEFGSLGQVSFSGMNETSQLGEGGRSGGVYVEQRFHGGSGQRSSADQPSSPHFQRGL